jgi:hypothetical protein
MAVTYDLLNVRGGVIPLRPPRLVLNSVGGLGMPPVRRITQAQAQQDGQTYLDTRLEPRVVTFGLDAFCPCEVDLWDMRDTLIRLMSEFANGFVLRVNLLPHGVRRYLDLRYMAGLEGMHDLHVSPHLQPVAFQGIADDPIIYDPDLVTVSYNLGAMLGIGFPLSFPHGWGTDAFTTMSPIVYPGSWKSFPIIRITGPCDTIAIANNTSGDALDLGVNALAAGELLTIDCTPGQKTVTHSTLGNVQSWLTTDSDLATFCILPDPDAPGGINDVQVTFLNGLAATTITIEYFIRYLGL